MTLRAPFPWYGGKSRVAAEVWARFGDVPNYVEPFFGSGAVLLGRPHDPGIETVNDKDCVGPEARVLMADLRYKPAGEVQPGDWLLAFDEQNGPARGGLRAPTRYRRWQRSQVVGVERRLRPSYRLTFSDGTRVVASEGHLWLGGSHRTGGRGWRWVPTRSMVCNRATQRTWVLKAAPVEEQEQSFDAGWIGGFFDGEGNIRGAGSGARIVGSQNPGAVLDRATALLRARGFAVAEIDPGRRCQRIEILGGLRESLRALMRFRPERLISNLIGDPSRLSLYAREHQAVSLVSKEFLGEQEVVAIQTTTRTLIVEGLASHNCYVANFWRALQADPEGLAALTAWPVNECDLHARHWWLVRTGAERVARLRDDPDYYDLQVAAWWVWGLCQWIGSGWCAHPEWQQRPHLRGAGQGVQRGGADLVPYVHALAARVRRVRVCCGDWTRVLGPTPTVKQGITAVFLDPPYSAAADRDGDLYRVDDLTVAHAVREWAVAHGDDPRVRIALCGYAGEHTLPDTWDAVPWKAHGGYGNQGDGRGRANAAREVIWFSPHCLPARNPQLALWDTEAAS